MKMSVIMPAYNNAKTIRDAMLSALEQLSDVDELIVIDDASSDTSLSIAKDIPDRRINVLSRTKNGGIGAARNTGLAVASGDYISFLDADDLWPTGRHIAVLKAIDEDAPDVITGMVENFYCPTLPSAEAAKYKLLPIQPAIMPGSVIIKRKHIMATGQFNEALSIGEFIDLYSRVSALDVTVKKLDIVLFKRRIHGHNTSILLKHKQTDFLNVVRQHLARQHHEA